MGESLSNRQPTIRYYFFYLLFLPDTWQIMAGLITAYFITPLIELPEAEAGSRVMLFFMITVIGYTGFIHPARWFTRYLIRLILGNNQR